MLFVLLAWLAGQFRIGLVRISTEVQIEAPVEVVWSVLTDFEDYAQWNPLMVEVRRGEAVQGAVMEWSSRITGQERAYNAKIDKVVNARELCWAGPVSGLKRILFWGEHRFSLLSMPNGRVRFVNSEMFGGLATIVLGSFLKNEVRRAYDGANAALKARTEERYNRVHSDP